MPAFGAVYLGIAGGAMAYARDQVQARGRENDPAVQTAFAEMEILLETARAVLWRHTDEVISGDLFEQFTVQEGMARTMLTKHVPCTTRSASSTSRWRSSAAPASSAARPWSACTATSGPA